ncbi:MAG: sugar-binding transcriptional regulator [Canibacter sp.]
MSDVHLAFEAATMYYLQNEKMEVIGKSLGVSRSTVSRLLSNAREQGIVDIKVRRPERSGSDLELQLDKLFNVHSRVVQVRQQTHERRRLEQVATVAASLLDDSFSDGMTLGIAWGRTVAAIVDKLPMSPKINSRIVPLTGSINTRESDLSYATSLISKAAEAFDSESYQLPIPAYFDFPETRNLMFQERSVKHILDIHKSINVAIFGVGSVDSELPSRTYSGGYLDDNDMAEIRREGVVGDVCTVLIRSDGSSHNIALNQRSSGPSPRELQRIPVRVCVAVGAGKSTAIIGALRAGVATDLIIDDITARAVIEELPN